MLSYNELKYFLDSKVLQYNNTGFINSDPVSIPHLFTRKEDIEISAFIVATIAWGQRSTIIKNARGLMEWMDFDPFNFIVSLDEKKLEKDSFIKKFVHRTFNSTDCIYFLKSLKNIYLNHNGLEFIFQVKPNEINTQNSIRRAREVFFELPFQHRTTKHFSDPIAGSAAKRINMFLRWMVRKDQSGVDFGIWNNIKPSQLICPLDIHSGNTARKLGLILRKNNDWQAAEELTLNLSAFDKEDPVKYDFALFGLGVFEKF